MKHHPIFSQFRGYEGPLPSGQMLDFSGARFGAGWAAGQVAPGAEWTVTPLPPLDEEYFEWIDLLQAVDAARGTFTMLELGAGFGRWGIRGAKLAQQRGLSVDLSFVEAEPQHAQWLREALIINDVDGRVLEAALAYDGKPVPFHVGGRGHDAVNWYGQAIMWGAENPTGREYFGKPTYQCGDYEVILAPVVTLEEVIGDLPLVDLLDADLQAAELAMIQNSMTVIDERVRRVHIGTHGAEIEAAIRQAFSAAGWENCWDFSLQKVNETPYGPCHFNDGIQSWRNPRL